MKQITNSNIDSHIKESMLGGDKVRLGVLRHIKNAIMKLQKQKGRGSEEVSDSEIIRIIRSQVGYRNESILAYSKANDAGRVLAETAERDILLEYLPTPISEDKIKCTVNTIIEETNASGMKDIGRIIAYAKEALGDGAEPSLIAKIVKVALS